MVPVSVFSLLSSLVLGATALAGGALRSAERFVTVAMPGSFPSV
jgi:hypothetical protein